MTIDTIDPRTPVLVGWSAVTQREDDASAAREPIALMIDASLKAGSRGGRSSVLKAVDCIYVAKGRWSYPNPAATIRRAIGAEHATTVLSTVGVLQQTLIGDACRKIRDGEIGVALVVGGDAGYRLQRAAVSGRPAAETEQASDRKPEILLAPHDELRHPAELRVGLTMPVGLYAIIHSAFQARRGGTLDGYLDRIAGLTSNLSRAAEDNPDAWRREYFAPARIREPSRDNGMQAFPYTKLHCSNWSVDQAAALIFCSVGKARELGIPQAEWIFPLASTESNHMMQVATRPDLARCPGAKIAGEAALSAAGVRADQLDFIDLYSCFPAAVEFYAEELGLPLHRPLSVTGGMPFAGGPYNNYLFQATARMADLLHRSPIQAGGKDRRAVGLISCVSGVITKQGFALWSNQPSPTGFAFEDLTGTVKAAANPKTVLLDFSGPATVAGFTTLYEKGRPVKGVVVADTQDGDRVVAETRDPALIARMESTLFCGTAITVSGGHLFERAS